MDSETKQVSSEEWKIEAGLLLSSQVMLEYSAFYLYTACAAHFDDPSVRLKGLERFFRKSSAEEIEHAQKIIRFMNMRELKLELRTIEAPDIKTYGKASDLLKACKEFEQTVLNNILSISDMAENAGDRTIVEFFEDFIAEQVRSIAEFNDLYINCLRCGDEGLGLFVFDKSLL